MTASHSFWYTCVRKQLSHWWGGETDLWWVSRTLGPLRFLKFFLLPFSITHALAPLYHLRDKWTGGNGKTRTSSSITPPSLIICCLPYGLSVSQYWYDYHLFVFLRTWSQLCNSKCDPRAFPKQYYKLVILLELCVLAVMKGILTETPIIKTKVATRLSVSPNFRSVFIKKKWSFLVSSFTSCNWTGRLFLDKNEIKVYNSVPNGAARCSLLPSPTWTKLYEDAPRRGNLRLTAHLNNSL